MFGDLNDEEEDDGDYDPQAKKKKKETQSSVSTSSLSPTISPLPTINDTHIDNEEIKKEEITPEILNNDNSATIETTTQIDSIIPMQEPNLPVEITDDSKDSDSNDIIIEINVK